MASTTTLVNVGQPVQVLPDQMLAALSRKGLTVTQTVQDDRLVLRLHGKLVASTAPLLKRLFTDPNADERLAGQVRLDLDLRDCTQADGVGLATLVRIATTLGRRGGSARVINLPPALRQTVLRVNLHHLIEITE